MSALEEQRILYSMFYDMQLQAHWTYVSPDKLAAAVTSPGKPMWLWFREGYPEADIRRFFYLVLERYPSTPSRLVSHEDAAGICAEAIGLPYRRRELTAYYIKDIDFDYPVEGCLRTASLGDSALVNNWVNDFYTEALKAAPPFDESKKIPVANKAPSASRLYIWQAGQDNSPCAMGMLCGINGGMCRLNMIYTPPHLRKRGYARAVVQALALKAREYGATPFLYTAADNTAANGLYQSLGFKEAGKLTEVTFNENR
jgi:hypothetical protein